MAATPQAIAQTTGSPGAAMRGARSSTGSAPLSASARNTSTPIFQPSTRKTFVAPRLPEPCLRMSTPDAAPARYANGIEPAAYDSASASSGFTSGRGPAALAAQQDAKRIASERVRLAEPVVEEAHVVLLHEIRVIAEYGDGGGRDAHLGGVVELHFPARSL